MKTQRKQTDILLLIDELSGRITDTGVLPYLHPLIIHGIEVLGSVKDFDNWFNTPNFYFDNRTPISFLNTVLLFFPDIFIFNACLFKRAP